MKFHIILSKSMPIRLEADGGNIVSRGSTREFESTEKFQDPTEKTERCHREPARKTASARSHEIMREPETQGIIPTQGKKRTRKRALQSKRDLQYLSKKPRAIRQLPTAACLGV